jgi:AcrR family transcriptional regulator
LKETGAGSRAGEGGEASRPHLRLPGVRAPKPLLSPESEQRLTARQLQLLDELEELVQVGGLADLTMAQIAAHVNCSMRTLYGISPSRDELVLTIFDRRLHRIGRAAVESLDPDQPPLALLGAYLRATNEAVQPSTVAYAQELADIPGAGRLLDSHEEYVMAMARSLLDRAVDEGEINALDTTSLAHVLGGLGREFARRDVAELATSSPKDTADAITQIILRGLERG